MLAVHTLTIVGRCPVLECPDAYETTVRTSRVVMVEDIHAAVKELTASPLTQEELTRRLADRLGAQVETVGFHSGVRTWVTHGSPE